MQNSVCTAECFSLFTAHSNRASEGGWSLRQLWHGVESRLPCRAVGRRGRR